MIWRRKPKHEDAVQADPAVASDELMSGIAADARREAERLVEEAHAAARRRQASTDGQVADMLAAARKRADEQAEAIRTQHRSAGDMEARRITLRVREQVMGRVIDGIRRRLDAMRHDPAYRDVLLAWVVEGCIGLNEPAVTVNGSAPEQTMLDEALLNAAARKVKELTGRTVTPTREDGDPILSQGVRVSSPDGRIAFSNDVSTRLLRYQSEIRKMVYGALFDK